MDAKWLAFALVAACAMSPGGAPGKDQAKPEVFIDIHGKAHTPLDTTGARAVVLFFVAVDCPVANYYTSEINAIVKDYAARRVRLFVVHTDPGLTPDAARKHAKDYGFTAPVLIDSRHRLVKATGATIMPEAAVLTPGGAVAYRGRIDDTYVELGKRRAAPNRRDLRLALDAILTGEPVKVPRTTAIGCPINGS
jgi:peroxiredoxin